jgi:L-amino acid N-acyltransferase YncA
MAACPIRTAMRADAEAINEIQNHYVVNSTATFLTDPLTLEQRYAWLEGRSPRHPVTVAVDQGAVVGWGALGEFRSRPAYRHSVEFSIYIHHEHHRRGIGRVLLADLTERARAAGHHALIGGCCSESTAILALLEAEGYSRVAHFPEVGWKFERWLDVVFMQKLL